MFKYDGNAWMNGWMITSTNKEQCNVIIYAWLKSGISKWRNERNYIDWKLILIWSYLHGVLYKYINYYY